MFIKSGFLRENESLADKNWFGTGGAARLYCEPTNVQECAQALACASQQSLEVVVLGLGANVLISDEGFDGLVIRPRLQGISTQILDDQYALVTVGAGCSLQEVIAECFDLGLLGLEEFSGIPSSVGGALFNNLHYFQFCFSQFLVGATVMDRTTGQASQVDNAWFAFGYDYSRLHERQHIALDATLKLRRATALEVAHARGRHQEIVRHRLSRYPHVGTCGSFFRNFLDHEVTLTIGNKKMIYVAYYLDKIGIKGALSVGGAQVSHQHANMIVNTGSATSHDIAQLASQMQQLVVQHYGIVPQPECELIGFKEYPLLRSVVTQQPPVVTV